MKKLTSLFPLLFLVPLLASCAEEKQVYIVYFGEHKGDKALHEIEEHHHSYLQSVKESEEDARASLLYSYKHSINGFAAELTPDQASKLEKLAEVVSIFKSHPRKYEAHTTRSWEFVGLEEEETDSDVPRRKNDADDRFRVGRNFLKKAKHGDGIIVGVLDSGVWPESKSFNDKGMGPVPKSWKGICQTGVAFNSSHCNRKIIGARYYVKGYERYYGAFNVTANKDFLSPRDPDGHGSHTASTAVGRRVYGASALGGPKPGTLSNMAPWIITVGASTLDRVFIGGLVLGNGYTIKTDSITAFKMDKFAPLVYAANVVVPGIALNDSSQCLPNSLKPELVTGKVVLCLRGAGTRIGKGIEVKRAGGAGMILGNVAANGNEIPTDSHFVPTAGVTPTVVDKILDYIKTDKNPMAFIKPGKTVYKYQAAPSMTGFSSRGPNVVDPNILKPDITAPGLNILAAWSGADSPSKMSVDQRVADYNIYSGTSMSCPHVAGAIALLKAIHPKWSSAAIRSALMTTAWMTNDKKKPIQDATGLPANPFAFGSGHFRPTKAADPGLVYDASYRAYLLYGCSVNITNIDPTFKCPSQIPPGYNHNYPSIAVPNLNKTVTVKRTVTNVGNGNSTSTYLFSAKPPLGVSVKAIPNVLFFNRIGQKQRFKIVIKPLKNQVMNATEKGQYQFGWFSWTDKVHVVRSPIAVSLA
ncbi:unnamed protein product [Arabidopsis arenosa]|uniref:Subtilase family protein n=1 Tax=Arabidopsis arenosa TaxID=38785 RepID=A0A8S2B069_ARAAE|nr:unnamed protein product [Arabidopsis arenosa]